MNEHEYFAELISRRIDGDLSKAEQQELYDHLAACPECRKLAEDMLLISELAEQSPVDPPETLRASIMRVVAEEKPRKNRAIPAAIGSVLAASVAVVLLVRGGFVGDSSMKNAVPAAPQAESVMTTGASVVSGGAAEDMLEVIDSDAAADSDAESIDAELPVELYDAVEESVEVVEDDAEPSVEVNGSLMMAATTVSGGAEETESRRALESADAPSAAPQPEPTPMPEPLKVTGAVMFAAKFPPETASMDDILETEEEQPEAYPTDDFDMGSVIPTDEDLPESEIVNTSAVSNTLNVISNRLNIDRSGVVAVVYNGSRIPSDDPHFSEVAGSMLYYFDGLELMAPTESLGVESAVECVVEYSDGHSDTIIYSPDGYLNCNGVWYEIAGVPVEVTEPAPTD